ncbi:ankyrin repeat-containing protein ITN1-like [Durio zibethinus]|uniref:Ankyrin repeat-containing protein ITN1-like n=1 Tax=Durio zibethinus TaxID=66656 RepID=A0A6P5Z643_DURZI|nr:ankyrin repeat-containing protein ITN1-like [Durio zibethinus]
MLAEVVERAHTLKLLKFISGSDLEAANCLLTANRHLVNAKIFLTIERRPLHSAITEGSLEMVDELLSYMSEEDVKIQDEGGRTALHFAAMSPGNTKIAESLIRKNKELLTIPDDQGKYIPLVFACQTGHKDITHYLYKETTPAYLLCPENQNQAASVVIECVRSKLFGIKQIYDLKLTHVYAHELLLLISKSIAALNVDEIRQSSVVEAIINASERGMTEFIVEIIKTNPDLLISIDKNSRTICHIAVAYRQEKLFSLINGHDAVKYYFLDFTDNYGNNMLHLAGQLEPTSQLKLDQISGAALQMQRELQWFKEIESIVPPAFKEYKNSFGATPYEAFDQSHANLIKEGEKWMKDIAQSSTIVGTLIITIMFAALFTVPGGYNQDTGIPLLLSKKLFKLFIISDAISLFASSTSVLIFVGILTSRYSKDDFLTSLPKKLIIGLSALFISIATMMVAFSSTVIILLKGQLEIVIPIVLLATIPICLFVWLQFPLLVTITMSTYGPGIFDRKVRKWL